jgi:hypothetical protein
VNNSATVAGSSLEAVAPIAFSITNTTFSDTGIGEFEPLALKGAPQYDCGSATCSPGERCTFSHFSVFCETCFVNEIGDGRTCWTCEAGTHPSASQTVCEPCPPGTVGEYGICVDCARGLVSSSWGGIDCDSCPPGQVSSLNATSCECSFGRYNQTNLGFITCTNNDFQADAFDSEPIYAIARNQLLLGLQCVECPLCESNSVAKLYDISNSHLQALTDRLSLPQVLTAQRPRYVSKQASSRVCMRYRRPQVPSRTRISCAVVRRQPTWTAWGRMVQATTPSIHCVWEEEH